MSYKEKLLEMEQRLTSAKKALGYLMNTENIPSEKFNTLLEVVIIQFEACTIEVRKLVEASRRNIQNIAMVNVYHNKELYGEVEISDNGWLHIKLDTLLPNCKSLENSGYITDSITRLLNNFSAYGGTIPFYEKAFIAIIEKCGIENRRSFDQDNKGYKAIQNALKGRLFRDDNQFELSENGARQLRIISQPNYKSRLVKILLAKSDYIITEATWCDVLNKNSEPFIVGFDFNLKAYDKALLLAKGKKVHISLLDFQLETAKEYLKNKNVVLHAFDVKQIEAALSLLEKLYTPNTSPYQMEGGEYLNAEDFKAY